MYFIQTTERVLQLRQLTSLIYFISVRYKWNPTIRYINPTSFRHILEQGMYNFLRGQMGRWKNFLNKFSEGCTLPGSVGLGIIPDHLKKPFLSSSRELTWNCNDTLLWAKPIVLQPQGSRLLCYYSVLLCSPSRSSPEESLLRSMPHSSRCPPLEA